MKTRFSTLLLSLAIGVAAIARAGGLTVVQDPEDAAYDSMPLSMPDEWGDLQSWHEAAEKA